MRELNYEKVFGVLVKETSDYLVRNRINAMVLGISGGIDSTVVAAICHDVSELTGIPLIGRSLPIKNKSDEFDVSKLVGKAFCTDFAISSLREPYYAMLECTHWHEKQRVFPESYDVEGLGYEDRLRTSPYMPMDNIAFGNIQARLRMTYLYNLASINKGLVMSTDNQTEYQLGFWTLHGDVGDYDPIQDLWKTEVYGLAQYLCDAYFYQFSDATLDSTEEGRKWEPYWESKYIAMKESIALTPTDGLGISNSDLDQIGAKSYAEVDAILQDFMNWKKTNHHLDMFESGSLVSLYLEERELLVIDKETVIKVMNRHKASEFKRKKSPIFIERSKYE